MKIKTGYLYHIKDEFFTIVKDDGLMNNHENGGSRPTYFAIEDGNILWFIPLSTKVEKYTKLIKQKIEKYGECNTILIRKVFRKDAAILIQNAFPVLRKYIDHYHVYNNQPARLKKELQKEILEKFKNTLSLRKSGIDLFYADIYKIKSQMLEEYIKDKKNDVHVNCILETTLEDKKNNSLRVIEVPAYLNFTKIIDYIFNILKKNIVDYQLVINEKLSKIDINNLDLSLLPIGSEIELIGKNERLKIKLQDKVQYPKTINNNILLNV